jgi:transposase
MSGETDDCGGHRSFAGAEDPLARHYLREEFDVEYCERHVRRLMSEVGLSWKTARSEYYKSDERAQEAWQEGIKKAHQFGRRIHNPND